LHISIQFHFFRLYSVSVLISECHKWSAVAVSACLRRGPRGSFRSECCTVASQWQHCAWTVAWQPPTNVDHETTSTIFQVFGMTRNRTQSTSFGAACSIN